MSEHSSRHEVVMIGDLYVVDPSGERHLLDGEGLGLRVGQRGSHRVEDGGANLQMIFSGMGALAGASRKDRR